MTRTQWQDYIRPAAISNIICVLVGFVLWMDFAHWGAEVPVESGSYAFNYVAEWLVDKPLFSRLIDLVLVLSMAFLILRLNEIHSFIRVRTILPSALCILFSGLLLQPHHLTSGAIVTLLLFASISAALTLTNENSQVHTFNIGLLLGIAGLVYPISLSYLVVFFYFYYNFNILNLRTFLSTLTGAFLPLCYGSIAMLATGHANIFRNYLNPTTHLQIWIHEFEEMQLAYMVVSGVVLVGCMVYIWFNYQKEALKPRRMFSFFVQLLLFTLLLMLISRSGFGNLLYMFIILSSIIIGRVYSTTVTESKISLWSFRFLAVASVAYTIYVLTV